MMSDVNGNPYILKNRYANYGSNFVHCLEFLPSKNDSEVQVNGFHFTLTFSIAFWRVVMPKWQFDGKKKL